MLFQIFQCHVWLPKGIGNHSEKWPCVGLGRTFPDVIVPNCTWLSDEVFWCQLDCRSKSELHAYIYIWLYVYIYIWLCIYIYMVNFIIYIYVWLVVWNMTFIFPIISGMSSSHLTFTCFRGGWKHQPDVYTWCFFLICHDDTVPLLHGDVIWKQIWMASTNRNTVSHIQWM
jgi:hypothetical protein